MILHLGLVCAFFISSFTYSDQDSSNITIEFDDEDEDYSSIEEDLRLLKEEDRLHN